MDSRASLVLEAAGVTIHQLRTPELGDSSYVVSSSGEAALIDVQRDLDRYLETVDGLGVRAVAVLETHVHNDYLSGGPAAAARLGAEYVVPAQAGYRLPHRPLGDGEVVEIGSARLRALFTPGHTPHHMSYLVSSGDQALAVLSGGCLLVGACGRTDLIDPDLTLRLTRLQHRSARRLGSLGSGTGLGPTHGAGSFCTGSRGEGETWSTIGAERLRNPALLLEEADFVRDQLAGLRSYPSYYGHMAPINREGAAIWAPAQLAPLAAEDLEPLRAAGVTVVDARTRSDFAAAHVPGTIAVGLGDSFSAYLGWIFPWGGRFAFILADASDAEEVVRQCGRIGIERLEGHLAGGMEAWEVAGGEVRSLPRVGLQDLEAAWRGGLTVLDVRDQTEWDSGHLAGARHIHVASLPGRVRELEGLPGPVHVHCATGYRAMMAASLLEGAGIGVVAVDADFSGWAEAGLPLEREAPTMPDLGQRLGRPDVPSK